MSSKAGSDAHSARSASRHSSAHSHSSHPHDDDNRSLSDINQEIRALESERVRRFHDDEKKLQDEQREIVLFDRHGRGSGSRRRRSTADEVVMLHHHDHERDPRTMDEVVMYDRYGKPTYYKREKSPSRNVVRVEKDRKGRLLMKRSSR